MARTRRAQKKSKQELPAELPATEATVPPAEVASLYTESVIYTPSSSATPENITSPTVRNIWTEESEALLAGIQAGISRLNLAHTPEATTAAKKKKNKKKKPVVTSGQVAQLFDEYFGDRSLANWQRLCIDLGIGEENLSTVTKCKKVISPIHPYPLISSDTPLHIPKQNKRYKINTTMLTNPHQALEPINVNIHDFLSAIEARNALPASEQTVPLDIPIFDSVGALASYSEKHSKIVSRLVAKKGGPLRALLRDFYGPARGGYRGRKKKKEKNEGDLTEGGVRV